MRKADLNALLDGPQAWARHRNRNPVRVLDLSQADLRGAVLLRFDFQRVNLRGAVLEQAVLAGANFFQADLTSAKLSGANLAGAYLKGALLEGAELLGADLTGANLASADLRGANLTYANLTRATLYDTDLAGTRLTRADIRGADLSDVRVSDRTIDVNGNHVAISLHANSINYPESPGTVRLQADLAENIDPQVLADYASSLAVITKLISRVGSRIDRTWFEPSQQEADGNLLLTTASDFSVVVVERMHYGSPWWVDLIQDPEALTNVSTAIAGSGAAAFLLKKRGRKIVSFFLTLARPSERRLWLEGRVEEQKKDLESKRAETKQQIHRQMESEVSIRRLQIEAASLAEYEERIRAALADDVETRMEFLDALPQMMPLLSKGLTISTQDGEMRGTGDVT